MEPKKIPLAVIAVLTFIMLAASCGGDAWISGSTKGITISAGLWRSCLNDFCKSTGYTLLLFFIPFNSPFFNRLFHGVF